MSTEAATLDAPTTEAPMTPVGDVYERALAEARGEQQKPATEPTEAQEAKSEPAAKEEAATEPAKPASALEAALSEPVPEKTDEAKDPLAELPETLPNENRKDHWAKARASIKSLSEAKAASDKAIAELQAQVGQAKENPELTAKAAKLEAENAQLRDAITAANVELLPEFRAKYIDGAKTLVTKAQETTKAYGGDAEALAEALRMPEGKRRNMAIREAMGEEMDELGRNKIIGYVTQLDSLKEEAETERTNSQQSYEQYLSKQQEQTAAQREAEEQRRSQTFEKVTKLVTSEVPTARLVDPTLTGADEWNAGITQDTEAAKQLFSPDTPPEQIVRTAILGTRYPRLEKMLIQERQDNAQMKKQLAEYTSSEPDVRGGKPAPKGGKEANLEKDAGSVFVETMAQLANRED